MQHCLRDIYRRFGITSDCRTVTNYQDGGDIRILRSSDTFTRLRGGTPKKTFAVSPVCTVSNQQLSPICTVTNQHSILSQINKQLSPLHTVPNQQTIITTPYCPKSTNNYHHSILSQINKQLSPLHTVPNLQTIITTPYCPKSTNNYHHSILSQINKQLSPLRIAKHPWRQKTSTVPRGKPDVPHRTWLAHDHVLHCCGF
jgi:hypothetical protein